MDKSLPSPLWPAALAPCRPSCYTEQVCTKLWRNNTNKVQQATRLSTNCHQLSSTRPNAAVVGFNNRIAYQQKISHQGCIMNWNDPLGMPGWTSDQNLCVCGFGLLVCSAPDFSSFYFESAFRGDHQVVACVVSNTYLIRPFSEKKLETCNKKAVHHHSKFQTQPRLIVAKKC